MSTSGGSGPAGTLQQGTGHLDTAAMRALFTAPTQIVAAPGAGKALIPIQGVIQVVPTTTSKIANAPSTIQLFWGTNDAAKSALNASTPSFMVDTTAAVPVVGQLCTPSTAPTLARAVVDNEPLVLGAGSAGLPGFGDVGPVVTSTLADGATGYAPGDTGTIDADVGPQGGAAYVIDTVGALGVVLTYHLTAPGDGYSTVDNPLTTTAGGAQPGIGTGLTLNVTAVVPFHSDLYVTVYYYVLTLH